MELEKRQGRLWTGLIPDFLSANRWLILEILRTVDLSMTQVGTVMSQSPQAESKAGYALGKHWV